MSETTKQRLGLVKSFHVRLNNAGDKDELEALCNVFWESSSSGHFDKMVLEPACWEQFGQLTPPAPTKESRPT